MVWSVQIEYSQRWHAGDGACFGTLPWKATLLLTGLTITGYGLLVMLHPWIIGIVFGPGYEDVSGVLLVLTLGALVWGCTAVVAVLPVSIGRMRLVLMWTTISFATQLVFLLSLLSRHQAQGAAWAFVAFHLVYATMAVPFAVATFRQAGRSAGTPPPFSSSCLSRQVRPTAAQHREPRPPP